MSDLSSSQVLLDQLRGKIRAAILQKKWGDARDYLKQLKSIDPDHPDDKSNLEMVLQQGRGTLGAALESMGDIRSRLLDGELLEDIQSELANHMPRWRAFEDDFPELGIVAHGLEEHEKPEVLQSMHSLVESISTGQINQALEAWKDLGRSNKVGSGLQIQILNQLSNLNKSIDEQSWPNAEKSLSVLVELKDSEGAESYSPGLENYLERESNWIRWNLLLLRASAGANDVASSKSQTVLLEELTRSADEARLSKGKGRVDDDFIKEFDEIVEKVSSACLERDNPPANNSWVRIILAIAIVTIALILVVWYHSSRSTL